MTLRRAGFWLGLAAMPALVTLAAAGLASQYRQVIDDTAAGMLFGVSLAAWLASIVLACRALEPQKRTGPRREAPQRGPLPATREP